MKFTLTDTQWNLGMLGSTIGAIPTSGGEFYTEETVAVTGSGTVLETPLAFSGTVIYGWATSPEGVTERISFTNKTFELSDNSITAEKLVYSILYCLIRLLAKP